MKKLLSLLFLLKFAVLFAQKPELVVPIGHTDAIQSLVFSPDGNYFLTAANDYTAKLWDINGKELKTYSDNPGRVQQAIFTPDMRAVLIASRFAKLTSLDGELIHEFKGHVNGIWAIDISRNGKFVLTAGGDFNIKLWSIDGKELASLKNHRAKIRSVKFSPDGELILSVSEDSTIMLQDRAGNIRWQITGHNEAVNAADFSPDGKLILTAGSDNRAILWDLDGNQKNLFIGHQDKVNSVAFSSDGTSILTGSSDKRMILWKLDGTKIREFQDIDVINTVSFSSDNKQVACGSDRMTISTWDLESGLEKRYLGASPQTSKSAVSPDGKLLLALGKRYPVIWDLESRSVRTLKIHKDAVYVMKFSANGKQILTGSFDRTVKLWDLKGNLLMNFAGENLHQDIIISADISQDGAYVVSGSRDGIVVLWNKDGEAIHTFEKNEGHITSLSFSPDNNYLIINSDIDNEGVKLWDLRNKRIVKTLKGKFITAASVFFSPDGQYILAATRERSVAIWNLKGELIREFEAHSQSLSSASFSKDGKLILTSSGDKTAKLWTKDGTHLQTYIGHKYFLTSAVFSPDGKKIFTRSGDRTDKIYSIEGKELLTLVSLKEGGWAVSSPSGRFDANLEGINQLYFVQGTELISLDQLRERYEEPGLLSKVMGFNSEPLKEVKGFGHLKLAPKVQLSLNGSTLKVQLTKREGGIGSVNFFIDGSEKIADINPQRKDQVEIDLSRFERFFLAGEKSKIGIVAYDQSGSLESPMASIDFVPEINKSTNTENQSTPSASPSNSYARIFALSIGTGDYSGGESLDLSYAERDAEQMANVLEKASRLLSKKENPDVRILQTCKSCKDDEKLLPSKVNIEKEINRIALESKPQDLFVLYLSGHGKAYQDNWYYLTYEMSNENLTDEEVRKNRAISSVEIKEWLAKIPARKKVLIIDACASGQLNQEFTKGKDIPTSDIRAINRLGKHAGLHIISASTGNQASYEASPYGMGLLTYGLIKGMLGEALRDEQYIEVVQLFNYAENTIPKLASYVGRYQQPTVYRPLDAQVYDIGKVNDEVKQTVNLPKSPKPMFSSAEVPP